MKFHPNLTRQSVRDKGPSPMAFMIASEFGRAANRSEHRDIVIKCYERARKLMGILETETLPDTVSSQLKNWFERATKRSLYKEDHLNPSWIQTFCAQAAAEFNHIATKL